MLTTKFCNQCQRTLSVDCFYKNSKLKDGYQNRCKFCHNKINEKRYNEKSAEIIEVNKQWQRDNADKKRAINRKYSETFKARISSRLNACFKRLFGDFKESFYHLTDTTASSLAIYLEDKLPEGFTPHNYGKTWVFQFKNSNFDAATEGGRRNLCHWENLLPQAKIKGVKELSF